MPHTGMSQSFNEGGNQNTSRKTVVSGRLQRSQHTMISEVRLIITMPNWGYFRQWVRRKCHEALGKGVFFTGLRYSIHRAKPNDISSSHRETLHHLYTGRAIASKKSICNLGITARSLSIISIGVSPICFSCLQIKQKEKQVVFSDKFPSWKRTRKIKEELKKISSNGR